MNTGVEILLQRMKDCPEDFNYQPQYGSLSRWMRLVNHAIGDDLLTSEEKNALDAGMKEVRRTRFTELVLKELAGEGEPSDEGKWGDTNPYLVKNMPSVGTTLGLSPYNVTSTINANSLTLGDTTISEATLKQLLDARTLASKPGGFIKKYWWNKTLTELYGKK